MTPGVPTKGEKSRGEVVVTEITGHRLAPSPKQGSLRTSIENMVEVTTEQGEESKKVMESVEKLAEAIATKTLPLLLVGPPGPINQMVEWESLLPIVV